MNSSLSSSSRIVSRRPTNRGQAEGSPDGAVGVIFASGTVPTSSRAIGGALALILTLAPGPAWSAPTARASASSDLLLANPDAQVHFERGMREFKNGRFHDAIVALDAAYAIEPHPQLLYARAQARRLAGECSSALKLYEYFLATSPPESQVRDVETNIERCRAALSTGEPPPEVRPDPEPEGPKAPPMVEPAERSPPVRADVAGGVLTGVGSVVLVTGLGLLLGAVARSRSDTATSQSEFERRYEQTRAIYIGGGVALGIGLGLLVGGVARYASVARKRRASIKQ